MGFNLLPSFQSLVAMLPTLVIAYCLIKILSSGLNLVSKVISALVVVAVTYLVWSYVAPIFGVYLPVVSLSELAKTFNW